MYDRIGSKMKSLAVVICVLGIIGTLIYSIILWSNRYTAGLGFLVLAIGGFFSWVGSWATYAIGSSAADAEECKESIAALERKIISLNDTIKGLSISTKSEIVENDKLNQPEYIEQQNPVENYSSTEMEDNTETYSIFMNSIQDIHSAIKIKQAWQSTNLSSLSRFSELNKAIDEAAYIERMYGISEKTLNTLKETIVKYQ